jgi:diacylglycerol kinase (ATP)
MLKEKLFESPAPGFSIKARIKSFGFAIAGLVHFFYHGHNARVHLAATLLVILACFYLPVSRTETFALIFSIALVWISEMINTALEKLADMVTTQFHPQIKIIKDVAAGAVLVAAIAALLTGLIIFIPKILSK